MSNPFLDHHNEWSTKHSSDRFLTLKVKEGTPIQVRVLDDVPTSRVFHFKSIGNKVVICPDEGCLFCARGDEASTQHHLNVVDRADNKVKVLVYSEAVKREIVELIEELAKDPKSAQLNHPKNYDMRISRTGSGQKNTRYTVVSITKEFSPDGYSKIDIAGKLVPMSVEEQKKNQGLREAPSANIAGRGLKDFSKPPPPLAVKVPPIENVISDDDKEIV